MSKKPETFSKVEPTNSRLLPEAAYLSSPLDNIPVGTDGDSGVELASAAASEHTWAYFQEWLLTKEGLDASRLMAFEAGVEQGKQAFEAWLLNAPESPVAGLWRVFLDLENDSSCWLLRGVKGLCAHDVCIRARQVKNLMENFQGAPAVADGEPCPMCHGACVVSTAGEERYQTKACPKCQGSGRVRAAREAGGGNS